MWHLQIGHKTKASSPATLQYLVPYIGATTDKYFTHCKQHTLIIYDGLSKKAQSYKQMFLLLRRPLGRETYLDDLEWGGSTSKHET